ncbi:hypothetical protein [Desertivirga arenae]|uniref:hypothetical protein n=1 Tax=Desertivirga arenae TaxID=2810309 RepID=UPI001A971232|nr:hypothetical protein [Pedobacter sp. SYSU D00823]
MKKGLFKTLSIALLLIISSTIQGQDTASVKKRAATTTAPVKKTSVSPSKPLQRTRSSAPVTTSGTIQSTTTKAIPGRQAPAAYQPGPTNNTLAGQYDELVKRSWMQQGYQVVNPNRLRNLWKSVQDSLRVYRTQAAPLKAKISEQEKSIQNLKAQVSEGEQNLEESKSSIDQVSLLGMKVDKSTYNTIMWGIVITLAAALLIVLFTAGRSIREAKYRRQLFDEMSAEYQAYKIKANDKEKKLARELQTERNRVEELLEKNK